MYIYIYMFDSYFIFAVPAALSGDDLHNTYIFVGVSANPRW